MESTPNMVNTEADWRNVAEKIINTAPQTGKQARVIALSGDLGAGKTTLVKAIATTLGVAEPVTSPTFCILKRYETTNETYPTLLHMDAYRLESEVELAPLRFTELLQQPDTLFCIEWAEKIKDALPKETEWYQLEINSEQKHTIQKLS